MNILVVNHMTFFIECGQRICPYIFITLSPPIALQSGCCSHTVSLRPDDIFSWSAVEFGCRPAGCGIISRNWGLFGITQSPELPKIVLTLRLLKVEIIFEV